MVLGLMVWARKAWELLSPLVGCVLGIFNNCCPLDWLCARNVWECLYPLPPLINCISSDSKLVPGQVSHAIVTHFRHLDFGTYGVFSQFPNRLLVYGFVETSVSCPRNGQFCHRA